MRLVVVVDSIIIGVVVVPEAGTTVPFSVVVIGVVSTIVVLLPRLRRRLNRPVRAGCVVV